MSDQDLFVFGCAVTFIALAGIYVFLREHFLWGEPRKPVKVPSGREGPSSSHDARPARPQS